MSYYDLISLYKEENLNQVSGFLDVMKELDCKTIADSYKQLRDELAPQRTNPYFVDSHDGIASSKGSSNRREEHLALALFNASKENRLFVLPDGRNLKFIDYQTPLKAKQGDKGIGKVDLFASINDSAPTVVELKIDGTDGAKSDSPVRALLEGVAYCAIIEKNLPKITKEAKSRFSISFNQAVPSLIVLAPDEYWLRYLHNSASGDWLPEIQTMCTELSSLLNLDIMLLSLKDSEFEMGLDGNPSKLLNDCQIVSVDSLA